MESNLPKTNEAQRILAIEGMSCASCVRSVETALKSVAGVTQTSVNYADGSALVAGQAPTDELVAAVQRAGYGASPATSLDSSAEGEELSKAFRHSLLRTLPALALAALLMVDMHLPFLPAKSNLYFWGGITALVAWAIWYVGGHFYARALSAASQGLATMDTLIALGTGAAFVYSLLALFQPELLPQGARHLYFEAALFVIGFVALGKALETNAKGRTSLAVKKLLNLTPQTVARVTEAGEETVPLSAVQPGDRLRLRPGEKVPVDGLLLEGSTSIDEAMMTGESLPIDKSPGDLVTAGTSNLTGLVLIEAKAVGEATRLAQLVQLVRRAQNTKPRIGHLVDRVASVFVPVVMLVALATALGWWLFGPEPRLPFMLVTAMSVLVIACPCALGLAVPMSIMVGTGRAAESGLLIKNGEALQAASSLSMVVVDKTGTLTQGKPQVTSVAAMADETLLLQTACDLEQASQHPLGLAVLKYCEGRGLAPAGAERLEVMPGGGVKGSVAGDQAAVGSARFLAEQGIDVSAAPASQGGETQILVGRAGKLLGSLGLFDELKPSTKEAVQALHVLGIQVTMLTGDNPAAAHRIASRLGITYKAEASPADKQAFVRNAQAAGEKVGMAGDGINDAPALAAADVGFALGQGEDIALESADIALLSDDLIGVAKAIHLSRRVMRNIHQNLLGAFGYNTLLIPLAAGTLYPTLGLLIHPAFAGLAMAASSVTVVLNAARLRLETGSL